MKLLVLIALLTILISLGSALYYLLFDRQRSERTVRALTFRIGLSLGLFLLLVLSFAMGWIKPHGLAKGKLISAPINAQGVLNP